MRSAKQFLYMAIISIIIPAYNEARTIAEVLRRVSAASLPAEYKKEILVVDDGSTDDTPFILESVKNEIPFRLFTHAHNRGKGAAIRTALPHVAGDFVLIQDADLEYDPREYSALLQGMRDSVAAVYGARGTAKYPKRGFHFVVGARILTALIHVLFRRAIGHSGTRLTDAYTGYKVFRTAALRSLPLAARGFEFEAEVTCALVKRGLCIAEVSLSRYAPRSVAEGKKIGWRDAWRGFSTIIRAWYNKMHY